MLTAKDQRGGVTKTVDYSYTPAGLLLNMQNSDGHRTDYRYDPVGRLTGILAPNGDNLAFAYDDAGRLTEKWFPNGANTQYLYNRANTLAQLMNQHGAGNVISQYVYTYDQVGNRQTHAETISGRVNQYTYTYDGMNRLIDYSNNNAIVESYQYSAIHNRQKKTAGPTTLDYTYLSGAFLDQIQSGGVPVAGFVYDANGNLTKKCEGGGVTVTAGGASDPGLANCAGATITNLVYDDFNRLVSVTKNNGLTETYQYDPDGRRIQKVSSNGVVTNYTYTGANIASEYDASFGAPKYVFTYGPGADAPTIRASATGAQYYQQNGNGNVVAVTNQSSLTEGTAIYDPWGNVKFADTTGTIPTYGFTGRNPDQTGFIYSTGRDIFLVPGITMFEGLGLGRDREWYQTDSRFAQAASDAFNDKVVHNLDWNGINRPEEWLPAAIKLASMINAVPADVPVYIVAHSRGGNIAAIASNLLNEDRRINLVITMGTPGNEYKFDMNKIDQGVALAGAGDIIMTLGGRGITLPEMGRVGPSEKTQDGLEFREVNGGHPVYYKDHNTTFNTACSAVACPGRSVTVGPSDNGLMGSATNVVVPIAPNAGSR